MTLDRQVWDSTAYTCRDSPCGFLSPTANPSSSSRGLGVEASPHVVTPIPRHELSYVQAWSMFSIWTGQSRSSYGRQRTRSPLVRGRPWFANVGPMISGAEAFLLTRGLWPSWTKERGPRPINARLETAASNGMFRSAFASARALSRRPAIPSGRELSRAANRLRTPATSKSRATTAARRRPAGLPPRRCDAASGVTSRWF